MQNVPPASIRERLLSEAVRRHELSVGAVPMIHDLLRHGLLLEQALVGTGLIPSQTFAQWMQEASGLPLFSVSGAEKVLPPGLEWETVRAWQVIPQKQGKKSWLIGLTDPWDQEVRAALEALAVEHGWQLSFAVVLPSVASIWLCALEQGRPGDPLMRYARDLVVRVEEELMVANHSIPHSWYMALQRRLARRSELLRLDLSHDVKVRYPQLEVRSRRVSEVPTTTSLTDIDEHPVGDWTPTLEAFFDQGMLVFLVDLDGTLQTSSADQHCSHEKHEHWRTSGKRWVVQADGANQEELFHLALSGYPGTVCFSSLRALEDWERAADEAGVPYAACVGRSTSHGTAWSLYSA